MRRWIVILRNWAVYERKRRAAGPTGYTGAGYARALIGEEISEVEIKRQGLPTRSGVQTKPASPTVTAPENLSDERLNLADAELITGDGTAELKKRLPRSVNLFATSPSYWPMHRDYSGGSRQLGFERTVGEYIDKLLSVFREAHRVGTDDCLLMIAMGDTYGSDSALLRPQTYLRRRKGNHKVTTPVGRVRPASGQQNECLGIPFLLASALRKIGWRWRMTIIWNKDERGLPESAKDRPTTNHEYILVFSKMKHYYWDADAIQTPKRVAHDHRMSGNPLLKNSRSVWTIKPEPYAGEHPATMPLKLAERLLLAGCPPGGTVCDPFGGPATVALAALRLGMKAISIDTVKKWTDEGRTRLEAARVSDGDDEVGGIQPHHDRLRNATARATYWQGQYYDLCRQIGEKPNTTTMTPAYVTAPMAPTVRLPHGGAYHGDCLGVMPSLQDSIDLAIWDLPYGVTAAFWDEQVDLSLLWAQMLRMLKPKGVVVAFGVEPFTSTLVTSQPELYRHQWHRLIPNPTNFLRTDIGPLRVMEDILVFSYSGQEFTYHPPKAKLDSPYKARLRRHKSKIYRITVKMQNAVGDKEYDTETPISLIDLQFASGEQKMPTQKPVSLLEYLIQTYSKAGDTVLDPTSGRFSTGVACFNTDRRFIGIEKDAKNLRLGVRRLRELGATDGELAAAAN